MCDSHIWETAGPHFKVPNFQTETLPVAGARVDRRLGNQPPRPVDAPGSASRGAFLRLHGCNSDDEVG